MTADAQLRGGEAALHEAERGIWFIASEKEGEGRRYYVLTIANDKNLTQSG